MDANEIMAMLPEHPREGMMKAIMNENSEQFGGGFLIYRRESVYEETVEMRDEMDYDDLLAYEKGLRRRWAASCVCTECGEEWLAGWTKGGKIAMYEGPDGVLYDSYDDIVPDSEWTQSYFEEGDTIACPHCGKDVTLLRRTRIRRGRTYQLMAGSVENVGECTAVVFWLASRTVSRYGDVETGVKPCAAIVIGHDGKPLFFSRSRYAFGGLTWLANYWKPCGMTDPFQARYHSYEAVNCTKVGGWMWRSVPDTAGKTGEKTGLADYVRDGGAEPVLYLLFWRRHPAVENIVKSGWTFTIDDCIDAEARNHGRNHGGCLRFPKSLETFMKWESARPCDILKMSRKAASMGRVWRWDCATLSLWKEMLYFGTISSAEEFQSYLTEYGYQNVFRFSSCVMDGYDYHLPEIDRYLKRQRQKYGLGLSTGMNLLFDYRVMLDRQLGARTPTPDELWPKNLRAAHDRLLEPYRSIDDPAAAKFAPDFGRILKRWGALQWTDGEYCALLPRCPADLIDEGHTLHHCVGTYSKDHASGKIIVFIRRYRRPERSYFTLNEDLTGDRPRRIQLHGYGNEYAHGKRLTIPKKVLEFCDRWERKVLLPTFREVKRQELEEKKPQKRKRRTKANENRAAP